MTPGKLPSGISPIEESAAVVDNVRPGSRLEESAAVVDDVRPGSRLAWGKVGPEESAAVVDSSGPGSRLDCPKDERARVNSDKQGVQGKPEAHDAQHKEGRCRRCEVFSLMSVWETEKLNSVGEVCEDGKPKSSSVLSNEYPFEDGDKDLVHMPRLPREYVAALTDTGVDELLANTPLAEIQFSAALSDAQRYLLKRIILENRDVFAKNENAPGVCNANGVRIETGDAKPRVFPMRATLPNVRPIVDQHIDELLKYGIIQHSTSPWGAAVVVVPKGQTGQFRLAIDYRLLNKVTVLRDVYPLPRIEDTLASLSGNKYFTTLDAQSGFHQIPMATKSDMEKTAFRCHRGTFEFTRLPFGVANGPQSFQRYMDSVLGGLNFRCALVYIDDVLVMSATFEQHLKDVESVFEALRKGGIHLKAKKCTLGSDVVKYLGHVISEKGISPDPEKTRVIDEFVPTTRANITSFHGMCSFYRKFVQNFSERAQPLTVSSPRESHSRN